MRIKKVIYSVAVIGVAAILPFVTYQALKHHKAPTDKAANTKVVVATIAAKRIPARFIAYGAVIAPAKQAIVTQTEGRILAVNYKPGQLIKKGDTLFTLSTATLHSELLRNKAKLDLAKHKFLMYQSLYKTHAISTINYEQVRSDYQNTQQLYQQAVNNAQYTKIIAPITGYITAPQFTNGNIVAKDDVLATMIPVQGYQVSYYADQQYHQRIKLGMPVTMHYGNSAITGKVSYISPMINNNNGFEVRATLDNNHGAVPGVTLTVTQTLAKKIYPVIDRKQAGSDAFGFYLYGVKSGKLYKQYFTAASPYKNYLLIKSGVNVGQRYVSSDIGNLSEGEMVRVANASH